MTAPDFSIVICNYDYGRFVGHAVESCLAQRFPHDRFEVIVVDDGSRDDSLAVLARYRGHANVQVIAQPNRGQGAAFHAGVERARGRFVCLLDSDDLYLPQKLARIAARIAALEPVGDAFFLCHDLNLYDDAAGRTVQQTWFEVVGLTAVGDAVAHTSLQSQFPYAIPGGQVYSRALIARVLDALPIADWRMGIDSPLAQCAALAADLVHYLHEPLALYRVHGANDGASLVNGRYRPKSVWHARIPNTLRDLGRFAAVLPLDPKRRSTRLAYVAHRQRALGETPAGTQPALPSAALVVLAGADATATHTSVSACLGQSHPAFTVRVVGHAPALSSIERERPGLATVAIAHEEDALAAMRAGYAAGNEPFVAFLTAGEQPDPTWLTRLVRLHLHAALVAVAGCDAAVRGPGRDEREASVAHALRLPRETMQRLAALASPLAGGPQMPLSTHLLRRSPVIDALLAHDVDDLWAAVGGDPAWRLLACAQGVGGAVRMAEALVAVPAQPDGLPRVPTYGSPATGAPALAGIAQTLFAALARRHRTVGLPYTWDWWTACARWAVACGSPPATIGQVARAAGIELREAGAAS